MNSLSGLTARDMWTFLFTDIEGSTRLWEKHQDVMAAALELHDAILSQAVVTNGGRVFKHTGDGMAASFSSPAEATRAAVAAQRSLAKASWPLPMGLRVRMGLHTGEATERDGDYFGTSVNKAARLMGVGHGGQVLLSETTDSMLDHSTEWSLREMGQHRLWDFSEPLRVDQLLIDGLQTDFPPLRTLDAFQSNLPRNLPAYIGRDDLVDEIEADLRSTALVTLAGIGGVGKTRLSQQVGAQVLPQYEDGVWFVDLAPLSRAEAVDSAVARVLAVAERTTEEVGTTVAQALRDQHLLTILDNCEQVMPKVASLVEQVIGSAPAARFLVTSRESLGVYGEKVLRLSGLDENSAVSLFVARAAEAGASIDLDADRAVIAELCRRLDGLPLAIELAAARSRSMTPAEILERVDGRFLIFLGNERRIPRHRTLEAMVDWSYQLLTDEERTLLNRLAVFVGSFDLASTEEVCADDRLDRFAVDDLLDRLVDKSLVAATSSSDATRFRLLETVRQFATQQLASSGEADLVRDRHVRFFTQRAQTLGARIHSDQMAEASAAVAFDVDNLDAAIDRLGDQQRHEEKAQLVSALSLFWLTTAPTAGRQRYEELVAAEEALEPELRLATLIAAASLMSDQGFAARSLELLERARAVAEHHSLQLPPYSYYVAATVAEMDGRPEDTIGLAEKGIAGASEEENDFVTLALRARMLTSLIKADPDRALDHAQQTLTLAQEHGFDLFIAAGHFLVGTVHLLQDRLPEAEPEFDKAIDAAAGALPQVEIGAKITLAAGYRNSAPDLALTLAQEGIRLEAQSDVMPAFRVIAGDLIALLWARNGQTEAAALVLAAGDSLRKRLGFGGLWWAGPIRDEAWTIVKASLKGAAVQRAVEKGNTMAEADLRQLLLQPGEVSAPEPHLDRQVGMDDPI
ncbi:MAG: adenylate/guanylate cyclase domain-containing protein [Acidimicrobiia bacterium]|nr:adenylate/guanylate cyclase domain-containing protein [Acidimicrobiia bacterium]